MLNSYLSGYTDAYILVNGALSVANTTAGGAVANNCNKKVVIKYCAR